MRETIDMTPTWEGILRLLLTGYTDGNSNGRKIALEELTRMAKPCIMCVSTTENTAMNTQQAINMIRDHGFHASMTADGLIAIMDRVDMRDDAPGVLCETGDQWVRKDGMMIGNEYVRFTDDVYFTETTVFAVDDDGHVDSTAIRAFLGY